MDILDDILETLDLKGALYFRTDFSGDWAVTVPDLAPAARFHLVMQGVCHVEIVDGPSVRLGPGDMVMIPGGRSHILSDRPGRPAPPLETVLSVAGYDGEGVLAVGPMDKDASTQMVCGHFNFRALAGHPVLSALPDHILITNAMRLGEPWLDELLRLMARRVFSDALGAETAVKKLSEVVFAEVIRAGVAQDAALASVLSGLRDPQIGKSLKLIHAAPEKPWSVASLAAEVGMSRSAFADKFKDLVGLAPVGYLADWRLQKALSLLDGTQKSVQRVASETGYLSSAAFSRAFSGKFGLSPSDYRRGLQ